MRACVRACLCVCVCVCVWCVVCVWWGVGGWGGGGGAFFVGRPPPPPPPPPPHFNPPPPPPPSPRDPRPISPAIVRLFSLGLVTCSRRGSAPQRKSQTNPPPLSLLLLLSRFSQDERLLHAGEPVIKGEKYGLNIWFREHSRRPGSSEEAA